MGWLLVVDGHSNGTVNHQNTNWQCHMSPRKLPVEKKLLIFQLGRQICAIRASNNNNKRDAHRIRRPRSNLSRCSTS